MKVEDDPKRLFQNASDALEIASTNNADESAKPVAFNQSVRRFVELINKNVQGEPTVHFLGIKNKGEFNNIPVELWQFDSELSNHNDGINTVIWFLANPLGSKFYSTKIMEIGGSQKHIQNAIKQMTKDENSLYGEVVNDPSTLVAFVNQVRISDGQASSIEISHKIVAQLLDQVRVAIRDGDETRQMSVQDHGLTFACLIANVGGFALHKSVIAIKATKTHQITMSDLRD